MPPPQIGAGEEKVATGQQNAEILPRGSSKEDMELRGTPQETVGNHGLLFQLF